MHRLAPSPVLLFLHFFAVAFYSIWVMYTHPRATIDSANPTTLTILNGHPSGYPMNHGNEHVNGYANGRTHDGANGHSKEGMDKPVVVMRRPNPLEYPSITVKAVQVVRPRYPIFGTNTNYLVSFGLRARYLDHSCGARLDGINTLFPNGRCILFAADYLYAIIPSGTRSMRESPWLDSRNCEYPSVLGLMVCLMWFVREA